MRTRPLLLGIATVALSAAVASGCDGCRSDRANALAAPDAAVADGPATIVVTPPGASALPPGAPDSLTRFFPKDGDGGFKRVLAGAKQGYAEAKLEKNGKEVAILSIIDAQRLAYARARFEDATEKVGDVPVMITGDKETSALVKDRYQVKVFSTTLDHAARKAILASFDLDGLGR